MASPTDDQSVGPDWYRSSLSDSQDPLAATRAALLNMFSLSKELVDPRDILDSPMQPPNPGNRDALLVLLPLLIVLSSLLFLLLLFLVCVLFIRRRRGIILRDNDGPIDMSREELLEGEGGFEGIEERWLESVNEETRRSYRRAKGNLSKTTLRFNACSYFVPQIGNYSTLPIPYPQISHFLSSSQSKRKEFPRGVLNRITN